MRACSPASSVRFVCSSVHTAPPPRAAARAKRDSFRLRLERWIENGREQTQFVALRDRRLESLRRHEHDVAEAAPRSLLIDEALHHEIAAEEQGFVFAERRF